ANQVEVWGEFTKDYGQKFPNVCKLATCILSLPNSTAIVERCFKQLKLIKTAQRSSLAERTLDSLIVTKSLFTEQMINNKAFVNRVYAKYSECVESSKKKTLPNVNQEQNENPVSQEPIQEQTMH